MRYAQAMPKPWRPADRRDPKVRAASVRPVTLTDGRSAFWLVYVHGPVIVPGVTVELYIDDAWQLGVVEPLRDDMHMSEVMVRLTV